MVSETRRLSRLFYARPVLEVARDCIGRLLIHETEQGTAVGRIVEAEAYRGPEDRAAHSFGGRRTPRTEVMYGRPGLAYVFFIYGAHFHFNLVTTAIEKPHAVLIRAVEPLEGLRLMAERRGVPAEQHRLTNGPGKLCAAFGIDRRHYAADLCKGSLYLAEGTPARALRARRVGIDYAGPWAEKPWRFLAPQSRYVSTLKGLVSRGRKREPV